MSAIAEYLKLYPDERLAALQAHCEGPSGDCSDGKLAYRSCCCLIGALTAEHALKGADDIGPRCGNYVHNMAAFNSVPGAPLAEREFLDCGYTDLDRRRFLHPLILAEWARREETKQPRYQLDVYDSDGALLDTLYAESPSEIDAMMAEARRTVSGLRFELSECSGKRQ